ncbi:hypothetical protein ACNS7O_04685 [Haloferacaceae archaeon DSL9]
MSGEIADHDPLAALSAFGRIAYSELVTVVLVSLAVSLLSLTLVSIGGAIVAACGTLRRVIDAELNGERVGERERMALFWRLFRRHLKPGIPLSFLLLGTLGATAWYLSAATAARSVELLLGALVGVYAVVVATVWIFRTASVILDAPADAGLQTTDALRIAGYHLLETPWFTVLQCVLVAIIAGVAVGLTVGVVLLLPGLLAVIEVVGFGERETTSGRAVVRAYQGRSQ